MANAESASLPTLLTSGPVGGPTDASERLSALDKFVAGRIEMAVQAEQKLARRLDQLVTAEGGLREVLESLRRQTTDAFSLIDQLRRFKESSAAGAADVLESTRRQLGEATEMAQQGMAMLGAAKREFAAEIEGIQSRAREVIEPLGRDMNRALHEAKVKADSIAQIMPGRVAEKTAELDRAFSKAVESASGRVQRKIEDFESKTAVFEEWLEEQTRGAIGRVQEEADRRLAEAEEAWQNHITMKLVEQERKTKQMLDFLEQRTANLVAAAQREWADQSAVARQQVRQELEEVEKSADDAVGVVRKKMEFFQAKGDQLTDHLESLIRKNFEQAQHLASSTGESIRRELELRGRQTEQRLAGAMESAESSIRECVETLTHLAAEKSAEFKGELARASDMLCRNAEAELGAAKSRLREHADAIAEGLAGDLTPLLREMETKREASVQQVHQATEEMLQMLRQRVEELREAGEAMVEAADTKLTSRLRDLRPLAAETLAAAEKTLRERVTQMTTATRAMVDLTETQLNERLNTLRPRALAVTRAIEGDLNAHLARLEESAQAMTAHLERRLEQRVEENVQVARGVLRRAVREDGTPTRSECAGSALPPKPMVEVFLDSGGRSAKVA